MDANNFKVGMVIGNGTSFEWQKEPEADEYNPPIFPDLVIYRDGDEIRLSGRRYDFEQLSKVLARSLAEMGK